MATVTYQCKNCGGSLVFDADSQKWECPFCHNTYLEDDFSSIKGDKQYVQDDDQEFAKAVEYSCPTCGAVVYTDENTVATFCAYCQSPVIMSDRVVDQNKPAQLIPFTLSKESATEKFLQWSKKRLFIPTDFIKKENVEKLTGIYVPFWLYDCNTVGEMSATGKNVSTRRSGNTEYTTTKIYSVYRSGEAYFQKIPADGSKKMDDHIMDLMEPYNYSKLEEFKMPYLSGFQAEKYDVDDKESYPRVKNRAEKYLHDLLKETITGYSTVTVNSSNQDIIGADVKYTLLPIWTLNYRRKGKVYNFTMNGESGKIVGKTPLSGFKIARFFGIASVVGVALSYIVSMFL